MFVKLAPALAAVLVGLAVGGAAGYAWRAHDVLPSLVPIVVGETGQSFMARLDTGAVVSSINAQDVRVVGSAALPSLDDTGKMVSFVLVNERGERRQLSARIAQVRGIRTADCREVRYHVYLTFRFRGADYRVLTNLNDRSAAGDKLLLGRNWLQYGFAVASTAEPEP